MELSRLLFLLILAGCSTPDLVTDNRDFVAQLNYYAFPDSVLTYGFILAHDYERSDPGSGYAKTYRDPDKGGITIYVYDGGKVGVPDGLISEDVIQQFFETAFILQLDEGNDVTFSENVLPVEVHEVNGTAFWKSEWERSLNDRPTRDYLFLTSHREKFLKIRITLFPDSVPDIDLELERIILEICTRMIRSTAKGEGN